MKELAEKTVSCEELAEGELWRNGCVDKLLGRDFGTSKVICINSLAVKYQGFKRYEQSHSLPKQRVDSMWTCRVSTV